MKRKLAHALSTCLGPRANPNQSRFSQIYSVTHVTLRHNPQWQSLDKPGPLSYIWGARYIDYYWISAGFQCSRIPKQDPRSGNSTSRRNSRNCSGHGTNSSGRGKSKPPLFLRTSLNPGFEAGTTTLIFIISFPPLISLKINTNKGYRTPSTSFSWLG